MKANYIIINISNKNHVIFKNNLNFFSINTVFNKNVKFLIY
jgi:hypothetical protein